MLRYDPLWSRSLMFIGLPLFFDGIYHPLCDLVAASWASLPALLQVSIGGAALQSPSIALASSECRELKELRCWTAQAAAVLLWNSVSLIFEGPGSVCFHRSMNMLMSQLSHVSICGISSQSPVHYSDGECGDNQWLLQSTNRFIMIYHDSSRNRSRKNTPLRCFNVRGCIPFVWRTAAHTSTCIHSYCTF